MSGKLSELCRNFIGKNIAICQMENNFRTWMLQVINFSRKPHWLLHTHWILLVLGWWHATMMLAFSTLHCNFNDELFILCRVKRERERKRKRKVISERRMWSKRNCIGSLDWFHPIKQWHRTVAQCIYTRNARSSECEIARKRTDHSEFHVKIHVAMINLSVQIVVNISIPKMLQLEVRFSFRL